jgi:flagellar biosynthesis/type III secretory pathway chaperone
MNITKRIIQNFQLEDKKLYPHCVSPINVQYAGRYGYVKKSPLRNELKLKLRSFESPKEKMVNKSLDGLLKSQSQKTLYVRQIEKVNQHRVKVKSPTNLKMEFEQERELFKNAKMDLINTPIDKLNYNNEHIHQIAFNKDFMKNSRNMEVVRRSSESTVMFPHFFNHSMKLEGLDDSIHLKTERVERKDRHGQSM